MSKIINYIINVLAIGIIAVSLLFLAVEYNKYDTERKEKVVYLKSENKYTCGNKFDTESVELINEYRKQNNLNPLVLNCIISKASQNHSNWMYNMSVKYPDWHEVLTTYDKVFAHEEINDEYWNADGYTGYYPWDRCVSAGLFCNAENIGWRADPNATYYLNQFKDSPSHNAMMLNSEAKYIGVGYKDGFFTTNFRFDSLDKIDGDLYFSQHIYYRLGL